MSIGIYCITNLITGQCYIGSSSKIKHRLNQHRSYLKQGKHHSILLQRSWDKYSDDAFNITILEECDATNLLEREQYHLNNSNSCFNIIKDVSKKGGVWLGERSEELKNKIRNTRLSKPNTIKRTAVNMLDIHTEELIKEFKSCCEASLYVKGDKKYNSSIHRAAKRKGHAMGYKWRFINK